MVYMMGGEGLQKAVSAFYESKGRVGRYGIEGPLDFHSVSTK